MFYVLDKKPRELSNYSDSFLLIKDNWDDWFSFETQYYLCYVDSNCKLYEIGAVKIGQEEMTKGQRSPNIPTHFNKLPDDCFSLGQSDFYYEKINSLGDIYREKVLEGLRDLAYFPELYAKVRDCEVTKISLMRDVTDFMITRQYQRIAKGNARLTKYEIKYTYPTMDNVKPVILNFNVIPESNPPTNIHVVIGRNNVGKTHLIKNIIYSIYSVDDKIDHGVLSSTIDSTESLFDEEKQVFANVLCVSFSPFDDYSDILDCVSNNKTMPFTYIGIKQGLLEDLVDAESLETSAERDQHQIPLAKVLEQDFCNSLNNCIYSRRKLKMLMKTMKILESDPVFASSDLKTLIIEAESFEKKELMEKAKSVFRRLSSGHQVIMLTLMQLITYLTERTFVILDEPENHLHPPLLAAFIRALSELLIVYNGVALIATHSPVILQEVPRSCVWKINRNGKEVTASRLEIESFGATIGALTREVFTLEVRQSGFHKMLSEEVEKGQSYSEIMTLFNNELGDEALALLHTLIMFRDRDES